MNPQLQVVGYIGPNRTAVRMKVRLFPQWVHNLHNHEKLVVVVAAYPSQHFATGFWSSFPAHYSARYFSELQLKSITTLALYKDTLVYPGP